MAREGVTAIRRTGKPAHPLGAPCYVRVTRADHRGYVEFEFTVGDDGPMLEMILPPRAFAEYCAIHGARPRDRLTRERLRAARAMTNVPVAGDTGEK